MKKMLIGAFVGGLILFIWQFLSWAMLNIHQSNMKYTPNQDKILEVLNTNLTEEGAYFLPNVPPTMPADQHQAAMEKNIGKPWATLTYHQSMRADMSMNMIRGFIIDFLAVLLLCYLLLGNPNLDFKRIVLSSIAVGLIGYLTVSYLNSIWFEGNTIPELIDAVVQFGLCGLWLGWWLTKK